MAKMGRPKIEINQDEFEKLCALMCTLTDIAGFFDCSEDTIERWCKRTYGTTFAEIYKKKSSRGKISIRRNQMNLSKKNAAMAIWLGKNYLGQTDAEDGMSETMEKMLADVERILGGVESVIE